MFADNRWIWRSELIKNLFLLTLTLFLFGCDLVEQDTRLICNCDYVRTFDMFGNVIESPIQTCYEALKENNKNNSLVFNQSKKKFVFNTMAVTSAPDQFLTFDEDKIIYEFTSELSRTFKMLDRVNLLYLESFSDITYAEGTPIIKPERDIYYNCRLTDGV